MLYRSCTELRSRRERRREVACLRLWAAAKLDVASYVSTLRLRISKQAYPSFLHGFHIFDRSGVRIKIRLEE